MGIALKSWILRIVASAILGGVADALTKNSRQNTLVRMAASLVTLAVIIAPLSRLNVDAILDRWEGEASSGERAAASGQALQASMTRTRTAAGFAAWIESQAAAAGVACTAQVTLDDELRPEGIQIVTSDNALQEMPALRHTIAASLGLTEDRIEVITADDSL